MSPVWRASAATNTGQPRLGALAASLRNRDRPREHDADDADRLAAFIADLRRDLGARAGPAPGRTGPIGASARCSIASARRCSTNSTRPNDLASDHASRVLDRLRHLDTVSPPVTRSQFRAAFAAEFEVAPGRLGRLGTGVTIGSLAGTVGLDADLTILLGAADGLLPPAPTIDPLITESTAGRPVLPRPMHGPTVSTGASSATSPPPEHVLVSAPRGDLRATTDRLRLALDRPAPDRRPVARRQQSPRRPADVPTSRPPRTNTDSGSERPPPSRGAGHLDEACADDVAASRASAMRTARRSGTVTEFDGDLTGVADRPFRSARVGIAIEAWPACPHAYFMRYLLGVTRSTTRPTNSGSRRIDRGNVCTRPSTGSTACGLAAMSPSPAASGGRPSTAELLDTVRTDRADEFERSGRTGRAANWFLQRATSGIELLNWFVATAS